MHDLGIIRGLALIFWVRIAWGQDLGLIPDVVYKQSLFSANAAIYLLACYKNTRGFVFCLP